MSCDFASAEASRCSFMEPSLKVYKDSFYGQDPSPILSVQTKHITCITLILTLVNVELV